MWSVLINVTYTALKSFIQWQQGRNLSDAEFLAFIEAHQSRIANLGDIADEVAQAWEGEQQELPLQGEDKAIKINHCKRLSGYYAELYKTMEILPKYASTLDWYKLRATKQKDLYTRTSAVVENSIKLKVPWQVIACLHAMEASFDPTRQILNGEKWSRKTTLVPKGKGPWSTFETSCIDAFRESHWKGVDFTNIESLLQSVEKYNGIGYIFRCKASPYIWSFSNHGLGTGKYIADGKYSSTAVSKQAGFACILKVLGYS
jgi:lysozyme family protein